MTKKRLTTIINSREALPVRAIPYVAGWENLYSPSVIAGSLANKIGKPFRMLIGLVAYHLVDGNPQAVKPHEWARVCTRLKEIEATIREKRPSLDIEDDPLGVAEWERSAALLLPAGTFVWLDEFLRAREQDWKQKRIYHLQPEEEYIGKRLYALEPIALSLLLDEPTKTSVMEGFESDQSAGSANRQTADTKPSQDAFGCKPGTAGDQTAGCYKKVDAGKAPDWHLEAVNQARKYLQKWRDAGFAPTVVDASQYCEEVLPNLECWGRHGKGDKLLAPNIKREALDDAELGGKKGGRSKLPKVPSDKVRTLPV